MFTLKASWIALIPPFLIGPLMMIPFPLEAWAGQLEPYIILCTTTAGWMFFNGLIQTAHRYRKPLSILSIVVVFFLILAFLHYLSSRYSSGSLGLCLGSLVLYSLAHNFRLRGAIGLECAALFGWGLGFAYLSQISFTLAWHWQPILVALGVTSSSAAVWCAGVLAGSRQIPVGKLFALSAPLFIGVLCLNRQLPVWYLLCFLTLPIVVRSDRAHLWICLMFNGLLLIAGLLSR